MNRTYCDRCGVVTADDSWDNTIKVWSCTYNFEFCKNCYGDIIMFIKRKKSDNL